MKVKYLIPVLLIMLVLSFGACTSEIAKTETSVAETQSAQTNAAESTIAATDTKNNDTAVATTLNNSKDYLASLTALVLEGTNAVRKFSQSGTDYSSGKIDLNQFKDGLGLFIKDINTLNDTYLSLEAPEEYIASHTSVGKALEHLTASATYLQQYIESNNAGEMSDLYTKAASELSSAGKLFIEAAGSL